MKKTTTITQTTFEKTLYECDVKGCNFYTEKETAALCHQACNHVVKQKIDIGKERFYFLENEKDFQIWTEYYCGKIVEFEGPGWYNLTEHEEEELLCGCCSNITITSVQKASDVVKEWQQEIINLSDEVYELQQLLRNSK